MRISEILVKTGQFELEILDNEDIDARWIEEFENVGHCQFVRSNEPQCNLEPLLAAIKRFDRQECIHVTNCPPIDLHSLGEQTASRIGGLVFDLKAELGCKEAWIALHEKRQ